MKGNTAIILGVIIIIGVMIIGFMIMSKKTGSTTTVVQSPRMSPVQQAFANVGSLLGGLNFGGQEEEVWTGSAAEQAEIEAEFADIIDG